MAVCGYVVAGSAGADNYNGWIGKVNGSGQVQWHHRFDRGESNVSSMVQTADGAYILGADREAARPPAQAAGSDNLDCAWVVKVSCAGTSNGGGSTRDGFKLARPGSGRPATVTTLWQAPHMTGRPPHTRGSANSPKRDRAVAATDRFGQLCVGADQSADLGWGLHCWQGNRPHLEFERADGQTGRARNVQWKKGYGIGYDNFASSIAQTSDCGYSLVPTRPRSPGRPPTTLLS
jgi:hypothetical protein